MNKNSGFSEMSLAILIAALSVLVGYFIATKREQIDTDVKIRQLQSPVTPETQSMTYPLDGPTGLCPAPEKLFGAGPVTNHDPDVQADDDKATNALIHGFYSPMTPGNGIGE